MGPRLFSRGNPPESRHSIKMEQSASMGPRLFSRGNRLTLFEANYKVFLLQWGHDFSAVEIDLDPLSFGFNDSFNGATTFQPWKF